MKRIETGNYYLYLFRRIVFSIIIIILVSPPLFVQAESTTNTKNNLSKERRDDGLTIVVREPDQGKQEIQFITLILKTGYAHDPVGKSGLTNLTNELIYHLLRRTSALNIDFQTYADYSAFHFVTTRAGLNDFCSQLDQIIRSDALLLYDLCNELVRYHLNLPKPSELTAVSQLYSLVYGTDHPYNSVFSPNYDKLDIAEINKWFRQIYKPNNLVIATSIKLPDDFLRKPAGRDLKEIVTMTIVPSAAGNSIPELKWTPVHDNITTICLGFQASKYGDEGVFATLLIEKYLDQKLWKIIREDNGLSYDPEVFYLLSSKPSASMLQVALHTLAPDTDDVINMIVQEFKKIATEGIPEEEITRILEKERKRRELINKDFESAIKNAALYGLFDQHWLVDQEEYFISLKEGASMVTKVMTEGLTRLKIAIAGPEEIGKHISNVTKEFSLLPKK